jgi:hypothetical protein
MNSLNSLQTTCPHDPAKNPGFSPERGGFSRKNPGFSPDREGFPRKNPSFPRKNPGAPQKEKGWQSVEDLVLPAGRSSPYSDTKALVRKGTNASVCSFLKL